MAHPKGRTSKTRKRKRRTHQKAAMPQIAVCQTTGESHLYHNAYQVDGDIYYRGRVLIKSSEEDQD